MKMLAKYWTGVVSNENGFVMVLSLCILVTLTIMGLAASRNTSFELQLAGNERLAKDAFYSAESGWMRGFQWLENWGSSSAPPLQNGLQADPEKPLVAQQDNQEQGRGSYSFTIKRDGAPRKMQGNSKQYLKFSYIIASSGSGSGNARRVVEVGVDKVSK